MSLSLLSCHPGPPGFPEVEAEEVEGPLPGVSEARPEPRSHPPVEAKATALPRAAPPPVASKPPCDPSDFAGTPPNLRALVGLWKNEENGRLLVRSDRAGRLSLSYEARGDRSPWLASLAGEKAPREALDFYLAVPAVPERKWRYEVKAEGKSRLVGIVTEITLHTDGDGPESSVPQPVSLVRLCGP
ncbi:MAG: hypothetical protein MUF64_01065 [Polyangiaceae bacterium]|nr:hypothetical protein [Polyangiaceae bacterium]